MRSQVYALVVLAAVGVGGGWALAPQPNADGAEASGSGIPQLSGHSGFSGHDVAVRLNLQKFRGICSKLAALPKNDPKNLDHAYQLVKEYQSIDLDLVTSARLQNLVTPDDMSCAMALMAIAAEVELPR